ncbi:MAG: DUF2490 domain-containing protein [Gemmatimonadetes bacterium]|nr:DUF2490 domain-containing protein [Gemmatimonadota bacterium]
MHRLRRILLAATVSVPCAFTGAAPLAAQPWITRHQDAAWVGAFMDEPVTERLALWFDGSWRRMDLGAAPQQLLLRPGVQYTLARGVRVGGGYGYIATAPYGSLPIADPTREHRTWQQLSLSHTAGRVGFSHRYRLEQRWISPLLRTGAGDARELGDATYQNRFRYMGRAQTELTGARVQGRPMLLFVWDELLMPIGGATSLFTLGQNRLTGGVGIPVSARVRAEVGYMNLYNAFAARRANEVNHTLWVSWHWTGK